MEQKKQQMRYSDAELSLIRSTFADDTSLKNLRKHFLQMEGANIEAFKAPEVQALLKKTFLPEVDGDAPIHQVIDLWLTLGFKQLDVDQAYLAILARELLIEYFEQRFSAINGDNSKEEIVFKDLSKVSIDKNETFVNLAARNEILSHVEQQLAQLQILASHTIEDLMAKMEKDSTK